MATNRDDYHTKAKELTVFIVMRKMIKQTTFLRLIMLLWLFAIGGISLWAEDSTTSSGIDKSSAEEVITYDFTKNPEIIAGLSNSVTDFQDVNKRTSTIIVNAYTFKLRNCLKGSSYIDIRGDYDNSDPAYVQSSMKGVMTQLIISKRNTTSGKISIILEYEETNPTTQKTEKKQKLMEKDVTGKGDITFDVPTGQQVKDASITIQANFRLQVNKFTIKRTDAVIDAHDPWIVFKTLNTNANNEKAFPTNDNTADANEAYIGQIVKLESNGIEGFDPISTMANPYIVTYTVGGENKDEVPDPQFSNVTDGKKTYWKNGYDTYPTGYEESGKNKGDAIGLTGTVYRRGIMLGIEKDIDGNGNSTLHQHQDGDIITVKVGIFKITTDENGKTEGKLAKDIIVKQFKLKGNNGDYGRPEWSSTNKDLSFSPDTKYKAGNPTRYDQNMTVVDPTQTIVVTQPANSNWQNKGNVIIAKFSESDDYNLQSLLNAHSISTATDKKNMKSSTLGLRKLTAMQYTKEGIASETVAQGFYWFVPSPKQLYFEVTEGATDAGDINLNIASGSETSESTLKLKAYYLNDDNSKHYVKLSNIGLKKDNISFSEDGLVEIMSQGKNDDGTDKFINFDDQEDANGNQENSTATIMVKGKDNGAANMVIKSEKVLNVNGKDYDKETEKAISFLPAQVKLNINVDGGGNLMPPTIAPYSQSYAKEFSSTVTGKKANEGEHLKTYYLLHNIATVNNTELATSQNSETQADEKPKIPNVLDLIVWATYYQHNSDPEYPCAGSLDNDAKVTATISANVGSHYVFSAATVKVDDDGYIIDKDGNRIAKVDDDGSIKDQESNTLIQINDDGVLVDGNDNVINNTETTDLRSKMTASRVVYSDYIYNTIEAPVLSPGIEGDNHFYSFTGQIEVHASIESQNCQIFYQEGTDPLTFKVNDNGTITTKAYRFDNENPIKVSGSKIIRAIAYNPELGITSDVVTYRYALTNEDLDAPTFTITDTESGSSKTFKNGDKYIQSMNGKTISLHAILYDSEGKETQLGGTEENVNQYKNQYNIYYTTDGTFPSRNSTKYEKPFTLDTSTEGKEIYAIVIANEQEADGTKASVSDVSQFTLLSSSTKYWETTKLNCPNGILDKNQQTINEGENVLVNIEFGGSQNASGTELKWKHYTSAEYGTGNPIDNVGAYTIAPATDGDEEVADVKDELGNYWNHSKANNKNYNDFQTHKATFGLPASGAYVKFEPKKNGKLTIWCCQEGALYYNNKSSQKDRFNEGFLRKRPAYFIDESGISLQPANIQSAGVLSSNWVMRATQGSWNKKGEIINGIEQKLYTREQTELIYEMFNQKILASGATWNSTLQPLIVYLNTEENKKVAGFNVTEEPRSEEDADKELSKPYIADNNIDGTGICLPSASYMKYTFDVKAGKTYFFFGWMTKIGIRGFGFEPSAEEALANTANINSGKAGSGTSEDPMGNSEDQAFNDQKGKTYAQVTLKRAFTADTWTTLVLPFSVSASEVKEKFGEGTEILHYRAIENRTMYFFKHFHQMIVAGTPVLIKPAKAITKNEFITFENVTFESAKVSDTPCNDYGFKYADGTESPENTTWKMIGSYGIQHVADYNYYIGNDGKVYRLVTKTGNGSDLYGTRAYIVGITGSDSQTSVTSMAKAAYNNLIPESMSGETTDIDFIEISDGGNHITNGISNGNVYSLDGQLVRKQGESLKGLSKGIYIVNGKKVVVE